MARKKKKLKMKEKEKQSKALYILYIDRSYIYRRVFLLGFLQTFELTVVSPRKAKEIALKAIKEEPLSSKSEDNEKMSEGDFTKFAKKIQEVHKIQKS